MRALVREWRARTEVRDLATRLARPCASKDWSCEIGRLHAFVRDRIRFVRDPRGFELVQSPSQTLLDGAGDCDDQAVLLGALLEAIGHPVRFVAIGTRPGGPFVHVFLETRLGSGWVAAETTEQWPLGRRPSVIGRSMVLKV